MLFKKQSYNECENFSSNFACEAMQVEGIDQFLAYTYLKPGHMTGPKLINTG